jgi:hypothetical protein
MSGRPLVTIAVLCGPVLLPAPGAAQPSAEIHLVAVSSPLPGPGSAGKVQVQVRYRCRHADPAELSVTVNNNAGFDSVTAVPSCDGHDHSLRTEPVGIDIGPRDTVQLSALLTTSGNPLAEDDRSVVLVNSAH